MTYETDQRLKSYLDTNQLGREQMCRAILALDRRFSEVIPRHPRGGRDGGWDIQANFKDNQLAYAAVGFVNQANDSNEQKKKVKSKFKADLKSALAGEDNPSVFVFMTNISLTVGEKQELQELAKSSGLAICEIVDRERLRIALDSPDGFSIRFQHLGIALSEPEQASFFAKWGTDIDSLISNGFQEVSRKLDRMIFLQEANETLESLTISLQLDRIYEAEEIGHFRAFCDLFLKSPVNSLFQVFFGSSDKSRRFSQDSSDEKDIELSGIKHGISSASWELLLTASDEETRTATEEEEGVDEYSLARWSSRIGANKIEFIQLRFEYFDFVRLVPRPILRDFDEASYLLLLNRSLGEKLTAIHVYANGYKLNEFRKDDFHVIRSDDDLEIPPQFSNEELSDGWVKIRPSNLSSTFNISFSRNTPKRLFESPLPFDSLSSRRSP